MLTADGTVESESRTLLELEDVARRYRHPSIIDVKVSSILHVDALKGRQVSLFCGQALALCWPCLR